MSASVNQRKFILIDHSLKDLGGHYYTYASCVLPAAQRAGFCPVLAVNHEFEDFSALPSSWQAHAVFRRKSYSQRTLDTSEPGGAIGSWWTRGRDAWRARTRQRIAESFAQDCAELFSRVALRSEDHVFIATASELDLDGLGLFLQQHAPASDVRWHLQFHLGIFEGRDPDYALQNGRKQAMHAIFQQALQRASGHVLQLYCTTEQLTAQYRTLGVTHFATLPYPVHPLFREEAEKANATRPVQISCLGHSRREKGYRELPLIVRKLWKDYLSTGRAQLMMQTRRRDLRRALDSAVNQMGAHSPVPPVVYAPFPLALEQYAALVRDSDVGLMLYDSTRYYARCSGVLLEMLTAGVPVIVPAGSWLAEQIAEQNQHYLEKVALQTALAAPVGGTKLTWSQPAHAQTVTFDNNPISCEFPLTGKPASLLLRFSWINPAPGTFISIEFQQWDARGTLRATFPVVLGSRQENAKIHVVLQCSADAVQARLVWRNAWDNQTVAVREIDLLPHFAGHLPAGAVGLTSANLDQSAELLDDILQHLDHYRHHAALFATHCAQHHSAEQIIARLTSA